MTKKKVVIAEDNGHFRDVLRGMLSARPDVEVVGEARDGVEALEVIKNTTPDLVLLDFSMPRLSGISVIGEIKEWSPDTKILIVTIHENTQYVTDALNEGADGYYVKDSGRQELQLAIDTILSGGTYISPQMLELISRFPGA